MLLISPICHQATLKLCPAGMLPEALVVAAGATTAAWLDAVPDAIVLAAAPRPLHFLLQVPHPNHSAGNHTDASLLLEDAQPAAVLPPIRGQDFSGC